MAPKELVYLFILLLPALSSTVQLGQGLTLGLVFGLLMISVQAILIGLTKVYGNRFVSYLRALTLGLLLLILHQVITSIDPGLSGLLTFSLPMVGYAALLLFTFEPKEQKDFSDRMVWASVMGISGFLILFPFSLIREIFSRGTISLTSSNPLRILPESLSEQLDIGFTSAGLFFFLSVVFLIINTIHGKSVSNSKDSEKLQQGAEE
jgi:membrane protein CcdC involved in cytochrome C biogenesis